MDKRTKRAARAAARVEREATRLGAIKGLPKWAKAVAAVLAACAALAAAVILALEAEGWDGQTVPDSECGSGERTVIRYASGRTAPGICTSVEGVYDLDGNSLPEPTLHKRHCGARIEDHDFVTKMIHHFGIEWRVYDRPRWSTNHRDPPRLGYWYVPRIDALTTGFWCVSDRHDWQFGLGRFERR